MIRAIIETSLIDWDGKMTMVVFFDRCEFRCPFCQNSELMMKRETFGIIPVEKILALVQKRKKWIDGVVLSGGEPLAYGEQAIGFMRRLRETGTGIKLDTHGYNHGYLQAAVRERLVDYVAMDIKAPLVPVLYAVATGTGSSQRMSKKASSIVKPVEASIELLMSGVVDHEFRTTCVPGIIDDAAIRKIGEKIAGARKWALQGYLPGNARLKKAYPGRYNRDEMARLLATARQYVANVILRGDTPD